MYREKIIIKTLTISYNIWNIFFLNKMALWLWERIIDRWRIILDFNWEKKKKKNFFDIYFWKEI